VMVSSPQMPCTLRKTDSESSTLPTNPMSSWSAEHRSLNVESSGSEPTGSQVMISEAMLKAMRSAPTPVPASPLSPPDPPTPDPPPGAGLPPTPALPPGLTPEGSIEYGEGTTTNLQAARQGAGPQPSRRANHHKASLARGTPLPGSVARPCAHLPQCGPVLSSSPRARQS